MEFILRVAVQNGVNTRKNLQPIAASIGKGFDAVERHFGATLWERQNSMKTGSRLRVR